MTLPRAFHIYIVVKPHKVTQFMLQSHVNNRVCHTESTIKKAEVAASVLVYDGANGNIKLA